MARKRIYTETVSKDQIAVTSFGEYYVVANAELLALILEQDIGCTVTIEAWADCPEQPVGTTYGSKVQIDHGCKGLIETTTPTKTTK